MVDKYYIISSSTYQNKAVSNPIIKYYFVEDNWTYIKITEHITEKQSNYSCVMF